MPKTTARLVALLVLLPALAACTTTSIRGSGIPASDTRPIGLFERLRIKGGSLRVEATVGEPGPLRLSGDDNLLPHVRTRVKGDTLVIDTNNHSLAPREPLVIHVPVHHLRSVEGVGAVSIDVENVDSARFEVSLTGAVQLTGHGRADRLRVSATGESEIALFELAARDVRVDLTGASQVDVNVLDSLEVNATGASQVSFRGNPAIELSLSGASSVRGVATEAEPREASASKSVEL